MKKFLFLCVLFRAAFAPLFAQELSLDEAIKTSAVELGERIYRDTLSGLDFSSGPFEQSAGVRGGKLSAQTKIAVLNFSSNWQALSPYVIEELNNAIVRNGQLTVVDRQQLDLARQELNFQMSGEVDDKSAQNAGEFLGAQSVLTGSFTVIGKVNRFRIRVLSVKTGVVQYSNSLDIKRDSILDALVPPPSPPPGIFSKYTFFNGLTLFGYTYSPDRPLGFSLGVFGVYASMGFARPDWGGYKKQGDDGSYTVDPEIYNSSPISVSSHEIIDWIIGYNVTVIPDILYLPLGAGMTVDKEWRLQSQNNSDSSSYQWNHALQWESSILFEAGLLLRIKTPINFAPYIWEPIETAASKRTPFQ